MSLIRRDGPSGPAPTAPADAPHLDAHNTVSPASRRPDLSIVLYGRYSRPVVSRASADAHPEFRTETLVIDDGSSDAAVSRESVPPAVRVFWQASRGVAAACNAGLHFARGAWILFLRAGECVDPDAIAGEIAAASPRTAAILLPRRRRTASQAREVGGDGQAAMLRDDADGGREERRAVAGGEPGECTYADLLRRSAPLAEAAVLYRVSSLRGAGGIREEAGLWQHMDAVLRLARTDAIRTGTAVVVSPSLTTSNHSANHSAAMLNSALNVLRRQRPFVSDADGTARALADGRRFVLNRAADALSEAPGSSVAKAAALVRKAPLWTLAKAVRRAGKALPWSVQRTIRRALRRPVAVPPAGEADLGDLRRTRPLSRSFGYDRGTPVDRFYIERFLDAHRGDVHGRVLEIGERTYTQRFGGDAVTQSDVLHVYPDNPEATFVGDLTDAPHLPSDAFDCIVLTQTLQLIYDVPAALDTIYRILAPGGVLLVTVSGITPTPANVIGEGWYWSFTPNSLGRLLKDRFPEPLCTVQSHGNMLTAVALLAGMAQEELTADERIAHDPSYPVVVTARVQKPGPDYAEDVTGRWAYGDVDAPEPYDDPASYRRAMDFLDRPGTLEDWGCGTAFARQFVETADYAGIDGSPSDFVDRVADLATYEGQPDFLLMRHVLEHNYGWEVVLENALQAFQKRMVLIVFTPFQDRTHPLAHHSGIPDLAFRKDDLTRHFADLLVKEETIASETQYGVETLFYLERDA